MGTPIVSATVIISAFIAVQCLPDLARVDDYVAEELSPLNDDQPLLYDYYKRDIGLFFKCKYEKGKYPHKEDCSKYYDCTTGKEKLTSCPKHQLFDQDKKKCVDSKIAKCENGESNDSGSSESKEHQKGFKCEKNSDGHFPHEDDCKKYYTCNKGNKKEHTCPKKELYDIGDKKCRPQERVHCGNKNNPYDPGSKTDFKCPKTKGSFAHETDCSKHYSCKYDLARLKSCPKGKLFDLGKRECQNQEDVHCGNKDNPYDPDSRTDFKCPKSKGSFAHENDCTKYYSCKDDLARLKTCPKKKLFDVGKKECENHDDVHCGNKNNPYEPESKTDFECPKSKGTFAHEGDCSKYYSCKDNIAKLRTCPKNKLYDLKAEECENHDEVHCGNKRNPYDISGKKIDFQCPKTVGEFPHGVECNKYYSCKYGLAKLKTCPKKELFDAEREECRDSKKVKCGKRLDPEGETFNCPAYSFFRSYPDPSNCKNYYECIFGKPKLRTCPRNERYDAVKKICRDKNKVKCDKDSEDEEFVCPPSKAGNFSVPDDCSLYYTCLSQKSHPKSCPPEQLFDIKTAKCQDLQLVDCESRFNPYEDESEISHEIDYECPRQEGLYPHEEDCRSYYHCHKGVATIESCPAGQLFDVFKRRCANEKQVNCDDPIDPTTDIHTKYRRHRYRYFWCPRAWGIFYHRSHCGRYYHCWHRRPSIRRCSRGWFFDIFRRRCYEDDFVDCGGRRRRDDDDDSNETDDDEFKCPSSRGKYPHERECNKYYECDRKKATIKTCREGYLFEVRRKQCERHYRVDCGDRIDNEGVVDENNDFECPTSRGNYPYVEDCSRYFSCSNKKPTLKVCPAGQMYDVERGDCDQEQRVDCGGRPKSDGEKQPNEDGFRCPTASGNYPHESDCQKYYSCSNNLVTQRKCRGGQLFDVNRGSCEKADRVDCGDRFDDSSSSSEEDSSEKFRCPTSRGNHPHPDCHMYYSCSNNKFTLKRCPEGQLYDVRRRDCERWDRVDCGKRKSLFDQSTTVTPSTTQPTVSTKSQTSVSKETTVDGGKTKLSTSSDNETGYVTKEPITLSTSGIVDRKTTPTVTRGTQSVTEQPISNIITGNPTTMEPSTGTGGSGTGTICATSKGLFPHEKDCKKYYSCESSIPVLMACKDPELFDARKSRCARDVDCGRRIKPDGKNEEKEEPDYRCPSKYGNYPHEDCDWYYVCDHNKHILKKCPYNKHFDTTTHRCENNNRVDCGGRQLPGSKITLSTRIPVTGKVTSPEGSGATDIYTQSPSIDSSSTTSTVGWPVTGKSTDSNVTNGIPVTNDRTPVTDTHSRRPVTGTERQISSTDSSIKDITSTREPVTDSGKTTGDEHFTQTATRTSVTDKDIGKVTAIRTQWPVTVTDSNIGKVTGSRWPVTGEDSTIGKVTEQPITQSRRPITDSSIGELTGSGRPGTDSEVVTGSGSPATATRNPGVTSSDIGRVTGSGRPGTDSEVVTGSGSPATVTRNPGVTSSDIGRVTGSGRPGTDSEVVTGSGSPATVTRNPGVTGSDIGRVTGSGRPGTDSEVGTGSGSPATATTNPGVTSSDIGGVTGSRRPGTDSEVVTGSGSPATATRNPGVTSSDIGRVTGSGRPGTDSEVATGSGSPATVTRNPGVTGSDNGRVTGSGRPGTDSEVGTGSGSPATATTNPGVTSSDIGGVTGSRRPGTDSEVVTGSGSPATVTRNPGVTGSDIGRVTGSGRPGTDSEVGTGSGSPATVTRNPGVTGSDIGRVTGSGRPGTDSEVGTGSGSPATATTNPGVTSSDIGGVTGSRRPGTDSEVVTGSGSPATATRNPGVTSSDIGRVTGSGRPGTDSEVVTGSGSPATVTRNPGVTSSDIGGVTGSRRPGTDSEVVTGSGSPATATQNPPVTAATGSGQPVTGTESNTGGVTGSNKPITVTDSNNGKVTGSRGPIMSTGVSTGEIDSTEQPVTGSRRPGTDGEWPVTITRRPVTGTGSIIGEVTGSKQPINENKTPITGTDSNTGGITISGWEEISTGKVITGKDSKIGGTTSEWPVTGKSTDSNIGVTSSNTEGITQQKTDGTTASTRNPHICTTQPSTGGNICEEDFVCPTATGDYPHEKDCKKYYKCTNSVPKLMTCSKGKKFDAKSNTCSSKMVDCGSRDDPDGSGESHEMKNDCPTSKEGYYPNKNCKQFIICNKKRYQIKQCPSGKLYDASKKKCEPSHLVDCGGRRDPNGESTTATASITREGDHGISSSSPPGGSGNTQDATSTLPSINNITTTLDVNVDQNRSTEITRSDLNTTADVTTVSLPISKPSIIDNISTTTSEVPTNVTKDAKGGFTPDVGKETKGITENPPSVAVENSTIGFNKTTTGRPVISNVTGNPPVSNSTITSNSSLTTPEAETEAIVNATQRPTPDIGKITKTTAESEPPSTVKIVTGTVTTTSTAATPISSTTTEATTASRCATAKLSTTTENPDGILYCPEPNGLFPHPDPHKFVHCSNWEPHIKDCPGTLVFNRKLKVCSWTLSFAQDIPTM